MQSVENWLSAEYFVERGIHKMFHFGPHLYWQTVGQRWLIVEEKESPDEAKPPQHWQEFQ